MRRPAKLRILGRKVRIVTVSKRAMPDAYGQWHADKNTVLLRRGQSPVDAADTVLHEVMHAILHYQGRQYGGKTEEKYVTALASGLLTALRENPALVSYLTSATEE